MRNGGRMKKFLCSILIGILIFVNLGIISGFAASRDPYTEITASQYDGANVVSKTFNKAASYVGGAYKADYFWYDNLDFGDMGATMLDVYIAVPQSMVGIVEVRLDSHSDGKVIAQIVPEASSWNTPIKHRVVLNEKITGTHTLYICNTKNTANIYSFVFTEHLVDNSGYGSYTGEARYSDINGNKYSNAISHMLDLGFVSGIDEKLYYPDLSVTRGEFVQAVFKLGNLSAVEPEITFSDVDSKKDCYEAVNTLYSAGYITGYSDNTFRPNSYITVSEAVAILVRILGYEEIAGYKGGYTSGYLSIAREQKLFSGIDMNGYLKRDTFAQLLFNAATADYNGIASVNKKGDVTYGPDGTILSVMHDVHYEMGKVTATSVTSLYDSAYTMISGQVEIGNTPYSVGNSKANSLLGYECEFFYKETDGVKTLLSIEPLSKVKRKFLRTADGIEFSKITEQEIRYNDGSKSSNIKIPQSAVIIYNGKALDKTLSAVFAEIKKENIGKDVRFNGEITLIDNGRGYETVIIEQYYNIVIGSMDVQNNAIFDELRSKKFTFPENNYIFSVSRNGMTAKLSAFEVNDVVTVYESRNAKGMKLVRLLGTDSTITGYVEYSDNDKITVASENYKKSEESQSTLFAGLNGVIRLNVYGEAVSFSEKVADDLMLGIILDKALEVGLSSVYKLKMVTDDGDINIYNLADRCLLDGVMRKEAQTADAALSSLTLNTPCLYRLNENNEITYLDTAVMWAKDYNDVVKELTNGEVTGYISNSTNIIDVNGMGMYPVASDCKMINMFDDEEKIQIYNNVSLSTDIGYKCNIYTLNYDSSVADVLLMHNTTPSLVSTNPILVDDYSIVLNEKGEQCFKLEGYAGALKTSVILNLENTDPTSQLYKIIRNVRKGDIIRAVNNALDEVENADLLIMHDGKSTLVEGVAPVLNKTTVSSGSVQPGRMLIGKIVKKEDNFLFVDNNSDGIYDDAISVTDGVSKFDGTEISVGLNVKEISVGDMIFAYIYQKKTRSAVIFDTTGWNGGN